MNFKNFSRAQFLKLRNGINAVGEFRYDTICSLNFVSIGQLVWKLLGGDQNLPQTYTYTHRHTYRHTPHTHTHTHTPAAHLINLLKKKRNKTKKIAYNIGVIRQHDNSLLFKHNFLFQIMCYNFTLTLLFIVCTVYIKYGPRVHYVEQTIRLFFSSQFFLKYLQTSTCCLDVPKNVNCSIITRFNSKLRKMSSNSEFLLRGFKNLKKI